MTDLKTSIARPRSNRWLLAPVLFLVGLAGLVMAAWWMRAPIAKLAADRWCQSKDLQCRFQVNRIGFDGAEISALKISTPTGQPFSAQRVRADINWPAFLTPQLVSLSLQAPIVRAQYDGSRATLYGLESLSGEGGGDARWPDIDIQQGQLFLQTPAGPVSAQFAGTASGPDTLDLQIEVHPARLSTEAGEIEWTLGQLQLTIEDGRPAGTAKLLAQQARFGKLSVREARLDAQIDPGDGQSPSQLDWSASLDAAAIGESEVNGARSQGEATFSSLQSRSLSGWLDALETAVFSIEVSALDTAPFASGPARLDADIARISGTLGGPLALELTRPHYSGHGAENMTLTGQLLELGRDQVGFRGTTTLRQAALAGQMRAAIESSLKLPYPLEAHGEAAGSAVGGALAGFDTGMDFRADWNGAGDWQLFATGPTSLQSANGLKLQISPFGTRPWLQADPEQTRVTGEIEMSGLTGAPDIRASTEAAIWGADGLQLRTGRLELAPWSVAGLSVEARLDRLVSEGSENQRRIAIEGEFGIDGDIASTQLSATRIFGGIDAVKGVEGWRVQTLGESCIGVSSDGLKFQTLQFSRTAFTLCPRDGRFLQERGGTPSGELLITDLRLPFSTGTSSGDLLLDGARVNWTVDDAVAGTLAADTLQLAIRLGEETLAIDGVRAGLDIRTAAQGALTIDGRLNDLDFAGSLIPAEISGSHASFSLRDSSAGMTGDALFENMQIADGRKDALYQPLLSDIRLILQPGRVNITAPVRLAGTGLSVASAEMTLALPELTGNARVEASALQFQPGGLQPHHLSEMLRGYFTDATGSISAQAQFDITPDGMTSRGDARLSEFSFQTLAFSRVSGVNGQVVFDSILPLSTPPGQSVTIESIDPGIPLEQGSIMFQIVDGREARLEQAIWPFAGGTLDVEPGVWQVAGASNTLTVRAEQIELSALTQLLGTADLHAEGTVSGRFPVEFSAGKALIRNAHLAADAQGGRLAYTGGVGEQAGSTHESVKLAFKALRNFEFRVLEIGADGDIAGAITLTARIVGHNDDVLNGTPFNFNVSIDSELARLLSETRRLTGTDWLTEIRAEPAAAQ